MIRMAEPTVHIHTTVDIQGDYLMDLGHDCAGGHDRIILQASNSDATALISIQPSSIPAVIEMLQDEVKLHAEHRQMAQAELDQLETMANEGGPVINKDGTGEFPILKDPLEPGEEDES